MVTRTLALLCLRYRLQLLGDWLLDFLSWPRICLHLLHLVSCLSKGLCVQDGIGIDRSKVGCCLLERFNFLDLIYLRNKTASLRYCVVREQRPLNMLLVFLLLLGLSLCFELFLVLSVAIPKIDLVILASDTPPDAVLLIPHLLLIPLDHLVSEIDLGLPPFVQ